MLLPCSIADGSSLDPLLDHFVVDVSLAASISEEASRAIVEWHGKRSMEIAGMAQSSAELRTALCPHSEHIVAEAVQAYRNVCAVKLGDVLLRRVKCSFGSAWWTEWCSTHDHNVM